MPEMTAVDILESAENIDRVAKKNATTCPEIAATALASVAILSTLAAIMRKLERIEASLSTTPSSSTGPKDE